MLPFTLCITSGTTKDLAVCFLREVTPPSLIYLYPQKVAITFITPVFHMRKQQRRLIAQHHTASVPQNHYLQLGGEGRFLHLPGKEIGRGGIQKFIVGIKSLKNVYILCLYIFLFLGACLNPAKRSKFQIKDYL